MPDFVVIVPSILLENLDEMLFPSLENNSILPKRALVVDNSGNPFSYEPKTDAFPVEVIHYGSPLKVNASWNLGISKAGDCDYVSILNDDIIVGPEFFKKVHKTFEKYEVCAAVCPETYEDLEVALEKDCKESKGMQPLERRQGWAFTIKKKFLDKAPPIPKELITYCGDDWLHFWSARKQGKVWCLDLGNVIYHAGGITTKKIGIDEAHRVEKRIFSELKDEIVFGKEGAAKRKLQKPQMDLERALRKILVRRFGMSRKMARLEAARLAKTGVLEEVVKRQ